MIDKQIYNHSEEERISDLGGENIFFLTCLTPVSLIIVKNVMLVIYSHDHHCRQEDHKPAQIQVFEEPPLSK